MKNLTYLKFRKNLVFLNISEEKIDRFKIITQRIKNTS